MKEMKCKKCVFVQSVNGKLNCITHKQSLLYVYVTLKGLSIICQVGEDEVATARIKAKQKGEEDSKPILLDIAKMPDCDLQVKDGMHSVSEGKIFWTDGNKVTCKEHGACNCVNKERTIWRCLTCHEGAYVPEFTEGGE